MSEICPICQSPLGADAASCPACGFKLGGSTQKIDPINIGRMPERVVPHAPSSATFVVVRGEQINTAYTLKDQVYTIGRSPRNDIFLNDMTVSSKHAEVFVRDGEYIIRDVGSFNGVWINNQNITEAALHDGDIVQIGTFCLLFEQ